MRLCKIKLSEPNHRFAPFFDHELRGKKSKGQESKELQLWFDGAANKDLKDIASFLKARFHLYTTKQDQADKAHGGEFQEFANHSFYRQGGEANFLYQYEEELRIMNGPSSSSKEGAKAYRDLERQRELMFHPELARDMKEYTSAMKRVIEGAARRKRLDMLEAILRAGSSVAVDIMRQPEQLYYWGANSDAPRRDEQSPLQPAVVKYTFLPYQHKVLQDFLGVITLLGVRYETPRHLQVLREIVGGQCTEYQGNALAEYHQRKSA